MHAVLDGVDGIVCDLDGVIYRGHIPVEGSAAALGRLTAAGMRVLYCTNNSRHTVDEYAARLASMGIHAEPDDIVTSGVVTAEVLIERGWQRGRVILVGDEGVRVALRDAGTRFNDDPTDSSADLVIVGFDPSFDFLAMTRAMRAVVGGATLIATNSDASFPAPDGLEPGAGAILASIETASGGRAEVMGKPHEPTMAAVARRLDGCRRVLMIGDRPETDLAGGRSRGWRTVLVLTGVTSPEDAPRVAPRPHAIVGSLAELVQ